MFRTDADGSFTRRRFLRWSQGVMAAIGAFPLLNDSVEAIASPTAVAHPAGLPDYYDKLGVRKVINAYDTVTILTGSNMPPEVQEAVAQAAKHHVYLHELQVAAGEYIAKQLRCEGALVSCGACSARALATAACIQAANSCKPTDIPQEIGTSKFPRNEVIVQKAHRDEYDIAMYICGAKIVEVVTLEDYKNAFTPNTVMTNFINKVGIMQSATTINAKDWLDVAHQHSVPCHIDCAADVPPIDNLWKFTGMGYDLVCFSGGKGIRGPQNAGLLLGKKSLIDLAAANNNPGPGVGRSMKVAKEQLVGMVAAVDWILSQTDEKLDREDTRRANVIIGLVKDIPTMQTSIMIPPAENQVPHLILTYDPAVVGVMPKEAMQRLQTATPSIYLNSFSGAAQNPQGLPAATHSLIVEMWMLEPGQEVIVGRQIHKVLTNPKSVGQYTPSAARTRG
jgi:L-seryl-tRNA(Ser) seleniumtransferase